MSASELSRDPRAWDDALLAQGGHLLQSWRWGEFKNAFGWRSARVAVPTATGYAQAQVLFRSKAGISVGYIPRGPVMPDDPDANARLWQEIARVARAHRALTVMIEPDVPLPPQSIAQLQLTPGPSPIQPARTVKIALASDEQLLKQMHQKTRYNVRLAQRRGVVSSIVPPTDEAVSRFYALMLDTSQRNAFGVHAEEYYRTFLRLFGDDAALIFAEIEGRPAAGVISVAFGSEAIYMYGASSTRDRAHGAGFLIQFDAMRWAREQGCRQYDLWGIPAEDPPTTHVDGGDRIAGTTGSDWRGLYEFKTRFGGAVVSYPPPLERAYHPVLTRIARRWYGAGGGE